MAHVSRRSGFVTCQDDVVLEAPPLRAGSWEYFHVPVPVGMRDSPLLVEMAFEDDPTAHPRLFASRLSSGIPEEKVDCLAYWASGPYDEAHCVSVGFTADFTVRSHSFQLVGLLWGWRLHIVPPT